MEHKADGDDAGGDLPGEDVVRSDGWHWDESGLGAVLRGLGERIVVELHPHSTPSSSLAIHLHLCQLEWTRALPTASGPPLSWFRERQVWLSSEKNRSRAERTIMPVRLLYCFLL